MVDRQPEVDEAGDAVAADAARHDAVEMREVGLDVDRDAVEADPAPDPDADRRDLVLGRAAVRLRRPVRPHHPDPDPPGPPLAADREGRERADHPLLQPPDVGAHVAPAAVEVEHRVGDALARPVVGVLAAAPRAIDREAVGREQVLRPRRRAGGVERRMLDEPDELARRPGQHRLDPRLHRGHGLGVGNGPVGNAPLRADVHRLQERAGSARHRGPSSKPENRARVVHRGPGVYCNRSQGVPWGCIAGRLGFDAKGLRGFARSGTRMDSVWNPYGT